MRGVRKVWDGILLGGYLCLAGLAWLAGIAIFGALLLTLVVVGMKFADWLWVTL